MRIEIDLPQQLMPMISDQADRASMSLQNYVSHLIQSAARDCNWVDQLETQDKESIKAAIQRSLAQWEAGEIIPAEDVFKELLDE